MSEPCEQAAPTGATRPGPSRWIWVAIGLVLVSTVTELRCEGRRWWCQAGDWSPVVLGVRGEHTSQHLLDPYSLTHVLHGVLLYAALHLVAGRAQGGVRLLAAIALESIWEVVENSASVVDRYRAATIALGYVGDSIANSLGDIASCVLGFWLAGVLPVRRSLALFLGVEVGLLIVYRDNLLLNMIMLIHSFDAIRAWQGRG